MIELWSTATSKPRFESSVESNEASAREAAAAWARASGVAKGVRERLVARSKVTVQMKLPVVATAKRSMADTS